MAYHMAEHAASLFFVAPVGEGVGPVPGKWSIDEVQKVFIIYLV